MILAAVASFLAIFTASIFKLVESAGADDWRGRSIYQIVTDRFALTDGSSPQCDPEAQQYCGGTWQGVIDHLDYVQGMGFSAVHLTPLFSALQWQVIFV